MPCRRRIALCLIAGFFLCRLALPPVHAEDAPAPAADHRPSAAAKDKEHPAPAPSLLPPDAVTHHTLVLGGEEIAYTATAGTLALRDEKGEKQAEIFYIAFIRDKAGDPAQRPLTYAFNGGPGAASAYLDLGALGPRALDFGADGKPAPAVDRVSDNPDSWLPFTDLVFIDPVGTGFSRAIGGEDVAKKFWSVRPDLDALAQIVRRHMTQIGRLNSPLYLVGESYGGFRAARLAYLLAHQEGIAAAGIMLISPAIEFRFLGGDGLDLLPWALRLPSYAAVTLEAKGMLSPEALKPAEHFALHDYLLGLADTPAEPAARQRFYGSIAELIGLDEGLVARWDGRVPPTAYAKELRRAQGEIVSRYDGSVAGVDPDPSSAFAADDPVLDGSRAPFTRAFLAYAHDELRFETELGYHLLDAEVSRHWEWRDGHANSFGSVGASEDLARALALHPKMRVLIAHGLTDLTTPYLASRYIVDHLPPKVTAERVTLKLYAGGHMMYLRTPSRRRLHDDAAAFYQPSP
jgi:carboxypeptidase C (cathepsin A)